MQQTVSSRNRVRLSTYELQRFDKLRKSVVNVVMRKGVRIQVRSHLTEMSDAISTSYTFARVFVLVVSHKGLSPCDFRLIPKKKEPLRGIRFRTVPEILQAVDRSIRAINTTERC